MASEFDLIAIENTPQASEAETLPADMMGSYAPQSAHLTPVTTRDTIHHMNLRGKAVGQMKLRLGDDWVALELRRHTRANKLNIRYIQKAGTFIVTVPTGIPMEAAERFVKRNLNWIESRRAKSEPPIALEEGTHMPILGRTVVIKAVSTLPVSKITFDLVRNPNATLSDKRPEVEGTMLINATQKAIPRKVRALLGDESRIYILKALKRLLINPEDIKAVKLRDTIGHWAALSEKFILSASYRIIMAPPQVIDYVLVEAISQTSPNLLNHEIADQVYKNEVNIKEWLKTEGPLMHRFGASKSKNHRDPTLTE